MEDGAIIIVPREGRAHGHIAIREATAPLTSLRGAPAVALAELVGEDERVTTHEGELAGVLDDERGTRAIIWGDFAQTEITGVAPREAVRPIIAAVVRELVQDLPLGLGFERLRRFWYRPPAGWRGVAHRLDAEWTSPDGAAAIAVRPARPLRWSPPMAAIEQFLHDEQFDGLVLERPIAQEPMTIHSLRGSRGRAVGHVGDHPRTFITVAIEDQTAVYTMRLRCDGALEAYEPVFDALVSSIEPLSQLRAVDARGVAHWIY